MQTLAVHRLPVAARGSGTGLAGGSAPLDGGVVVCTSRMRKILKINTDGRSAHVEAGVLNGTLNDELLATPGAEHLHFAPDPSSGRAATIGGNAATNAGGVHTLKDFVTSNHVLGVTVVLSDGRVLTTGGREGTLDPGPFDLTALLCGSEGTLGVISELWVKLTPRRDAVRTLMAVFDTTRAACNAVSDIIASGLQPAALEMLDGTMVRVIEDAYHFGIPPATRALLLAELDGAVGEDDLLDRDAAFVKQIMERHGAGEVRVTSNPDERAKLWKARKSAFGAIGKLSHSYCTQDACVPRSRLAEVLEGIIAVGERYGLTISNVFHAGDGNVHPIFLYDDRIPEQVEQAMTACSEVLEMCLGFGGTITGEHGVGVEKVGMMVRQFDRPTLAAFEAVRAAFDPSGRANAGKVVPGVKDFAIIKPTRARRTPMI